MHPKRIETRWVSYVQVHVDCELGHHFPDARWVPSLRDNRVVAIAIEGRSAPCPGVGSPLASTQRMMEEKEQRNNERKSKREEIRG